MSEPLTIKTQYEDISELAKGLLNRVGDDQLVYLLQPEVAEGEWTQFVVLLRDGTPRLCRRRAVRRTYG